MDTGDSPFYRIPITLVVDRLVGAIDAATSALLDYCPDKAWGWKRGIGRCIEYSHSYL